MRTTHILTLCLFIFSFLGHPLQAQTCGPEPELDPNDFEGSAFFNYGSIARSKSNSNKTAFAVGQNFVGVTENINYTSWLGFYARYYLPPFALKVKATQGDLLDRIQVTWEIDNLGPSPNAGFNIYRDGIFLAKVDANIRSYNDFNVIAGKPYTYCLRGINIFGEGVSSCAIGFQVPNGVVTGWISTPLGNAVPDATVMLTPMQGFSAKFDAGDGAIAMEEPGTTPFLPPLDQDWTITFWIKTDTTINGKIFGMDSLFFRARPSANGGITIAKTSGGTAYLIKDFSAGTKHNWHHIALTYDGSGNKHRLYVDGNLAAIATSNPVPPPDTINFGALANAGNGTQTWIGRLDELRIYNHRLDELDFDQVMEGTASSTTPYLTHYWKMDEELGVKSYDIIKRHKLYFCGADFDPDRPPVHTAGITNEDGYYRIESASYGTGTTFLAQPKKNFYMHRSLKFDKDQSDYATLPDFAITKKATIEMWVNSAGADGFQCLLSKQFGTTEFRVVLDGSDGLNNYINIHLNGTTQAFTQVLGSGYQHLAFVWDSTAHTIKGYKNGGLLATLTLPATTGNWSDPAQSWFLGRRPIGASSVLPYDGLIDEIAVYDTILTQAMIQNHFNNSRDMQEDGLRVYFPLDEGSGNQISNVGSVLLPGGNTFGTEWSALAANQVIEPHVFAPSTRQVSLNPSVTSVDQVDFNDRSSIAVTGYVRYTNTDCFAPNVEILVNGESFHPKIFTDTTGKFEIDFDPGTTAMLAPKFEEHVFVPAFWQVNNVSSPIAGIVFNDVTTHKVTVKVKGGLCNNGNGRNITPPSAECTVEISSLDGCFTRNVTLDDAGSFVFNNLPPLENMAVVITKHNDPAIFNAFDTEGGSVIDISKRDTVVKFTYIAPPTPVITSGLTQFETTCPEFPYVIDQGQGTPVHLKIKLREYYYNNAICDIDSAEFRIINGFGDEDLDTVMGNSLLDYTFHIGTPNPSPPFNKTLQIIGKKITDDVEGSLTISGVVTGTKAKESTFTTFLPEVPSLILRDPPGDGSYSYLEKDEKFCSTISLVNELETQVGGDIRIYATGREEFVAAPLGVGSIIDISNESYIGAGANVTINSLSSSSFETCTSIDTRVSTSDDDLIVGGEMGGDVFMGTAFNIIYGNVTHITFDEMQCTVDDENAVQVAPGDFATTFIYSEFYILGVLIPSLESLAIDSQTSDEDSLRYRESIERWESIVDYNREQKGNARNIKNISFDAGTEYEYSETSDTTSTAEMEHKIAEEFSLETEFKIAILDVGVGGSVRFVTNTSSGGKDESGHSVGITAGYVLKDDDPLDAFTVDVGMDSIYRTPVFNIKAGQSSCPWEPGTANREGTNLELVPGYSATVINVPANEAAVFKFNLGNVSATNEDWTYSFTSIAEENPDGAIIRMNGSSLSSPVDFIIPFGESQTVTVTVNRGPEEYIYDSLLVAEISQCEYERHLALAIDVDDDPNFFSGKYISVHFIRPCSEVNITSPRQNWVVFPDPATGPLIDDNKVRITVSGYDLSPESFEGIKLQFRKADGNGAWINVPDDEEKFNQNWSEYDTEFPGGTVDTLGPVYTVFEWHTDPLEDGDYEIRAVTVCGNTIPNENGYSEIIKGRIDRQAPSLIGVPQPSDGVLNIGDEISFTFNQPIDCHDFLQNPLNAKLFNSITDEQLNIKAFCVDNKIVLDSTDQNKFLENKLLRAEIYNVKDLIGNVRDYLDWEFYVDRNELAWLTDSAGITKYEDEAKSVTVKIHNRAGSPVPFMIDSIPDWLHVQPDAGTMVPNEIRDITFTAPDSIELGWWKDSIVLHTESGLNSFFMGGDEALPFDVRTICRPPDWTVDPGLYQQTMTLICRVRIDATAPYDNFIFSSDIEDQVGVFIDGQCRGSAKLVKVENLSNPPTQYIAFVTIYGNQSDTNKTVSLEIFDASACLHYPGVFPGGGTFNFVANSIQQASPGVARTLQNNGSLIHEIPAQKGWNWISFNLGFPDPSINKALNNVPNPAGDLIKSKTQFAANNNNTWSGSLTTLDNVSMYMYQSATQAKTIKITGNALTPATTPIPIVAGWNWIGYIPTYKLTVNAALASLTPVPGDIIKSQTAFAQYTTTAGWVGNLKYMQAPNGYLLKLTNAGTLTYPIGSFTGDDVTHKRNEESISTFWNLDPNQYEHNMTLTGFFQYGDANATADGMELGAFVGDELRGAGQAIYIDYLNSYLFFLTTFANTGGEQLHFKLYDAATGDIRELDERMTFIPNYNAGTIEDPVPFTLQSTATGDVQSDLSFNVRPNPFRDETVCLIELPAAQRVDLIITDMEGKNLYVTHIDGNEGMNKFIWNGSNAAGAPLSNGVYLIRLQTKEGILTKKVVIQR